MNPGRIMPSVAPPPAMDVPSDLPSELWQKVVGHLVSEESGGAESVAKVACLCRSARDATSSDPDLWRCLLDAEYVPVTSRAETMHLEEYDGFISRFDERRIERSPSTASLGALTRGERERGGKRNIRREAREARKFYSAWANGKPAEDLVHWNAHALKDRSKRVLYGSRVNALVLDTAGLADHESRAPGFCWSCGGDGLIHRWDMSRGQRVSTSKDAHQFAPEVSGYRQINNMGIECAASCGPEMLITGGCDKGISLWDARLGSGTNGRYKEAWHKSCAHYDEVLSIAAARTLPLIISGGADDCVRVWDLRYMDDPLLELDTFHGGSVFCIAIDEETRRVYTGSGDKTISLWGLETGHWYAQAHGHHGDVYDIKVGKDNKVVSASDDGTIREWKLEGKRDWFQELQCVSTLAITTDMGSNDCELELKNLDEARRSHAKGESSDSGGSPRSPRSPRSPTKLSTATHVTCIELLGGEGKSFLGGCWSGDIVLGKLRGSSRPFSKPITKHAEDEDNKNFDLAAQYRISNVSHTPVTAITASSECVVSGFNNGVVRFSRMRT